MEIQCNFYCYLGLGVLLLIADICFFSKNKTKSDLNAYSAKNNIA